MRALFTAASGMKAQQLRIDNIANNLANVNTNGYKRSQAEFEDLYYQKVRTGTGTTAAGTGRNDVIEVGHGTRAAALRRDFHAGSSVETGNPADLAIDGNGMFAVDTPDGERLYTRLGRFGVDADGNLVTSQGFTVVPGVTLPNDGGALTVAPDGVIKWEVDGEQSELGTLQLYRFTNPAGLEALGGGVFRKTDSSGEPQVGNAGDPGFGKIQGGFLEASNVDVAEELIAMILAQRSYELTSKAIEAADQMLQVTNQIK